MPVLTLSLGSNINAVNNIRSVVRELRKEFGEIRCSSVYESEAVGFSGDNFLNLVGLVETERPLSAILDFVKQLEDSLGRDRSMPKFSGRSMDIDILTYGEVDGADCGIALPRPEITENAFVLQPLAELLPEQLHSETRLSFSSLWLDYDKGRQKLWPIEFDWQGILD